VTALSAPPRPVGRPSLCKRELLQRVIMLRVDERMLLRDICETLNEEGIPTPGGGARWYPSHVWRLLTTRAAQNMLDERHDVASCERAGASTP
jgi:hypothetical protein